MAHGRVSQASIQTQVKQTIQAFLQSHVAEHGPIAYRQEFSYEFETEMSGGRTVVVLRGHGMVHAHATYDGPCGNWEVLLSDGHGRMPRKSSVSSIQGHKVRQVCGVPYRVK